MFRGPHYWLICAWTWVLRGSLHLPLSLECVSAHCSHSGNNFQRHNLKKVRCYWDHLDDTPLTLDQWGSYFWLYSRAFASTDSTYHRWNGWESKLGNAKILLSIQGWLNLQLQNPWIQRVQLYLLKKVHW